GTCGRCSATAHAPARGASRTSTLAFLRIVGILRGSFRNANRAQVLNMSGTVNWLPE
ncbi:mCG141159, isoform CRA_c, partial [Mus musculus]